MKSTYLFDGAEKKEKEGLGIAIVTLLAKSGIASRSESRMIVYSDGTSSGTIGGGDVERLIIREASAAIKSGESVRKEYLNRHGGKLDILIDVVSREKKAIIFGSGHVSRALEEVLSFLHFDVSIVDSSLSDSKNGFSSSDADENTALIFTDHANRDRYYLEAKKSDAFYIGALSSRVKAVSTDERTFIPSGLDIGAESPEEVAVSIASEIVASLNKRRGISIKEERKRFIIVRGAGDLATAVIIRLKRAGYNVLALETGRPSVIRRTVSLAEAVYEGRAAVEGQEAVLIDSGCQHQPPVGPIFILLNLGTEVLGLLLVQICVVQVIHLPGEQNFFAPVQVIQQCFFPLIENRFQKIQQANDAHRDGSPCPQGLCLSGARQFAQDSGGAKHGSIGDHCCYQAEECQNGKIFRSHTVQQLYGTKVLFQRISGGYFLFHQKSLPS